MGRKRPGRPLLRVDRRGRGGAYWDTPPHSRISPPLFSSLWRMCVRSIASFRHQALLSLTPLNHRTACLGTVPFEYWARVQQSFRVTLCHRVVEVCLVRCDFWSDFPWLSRIRSFQKPVWSGCSLSREGRRPTGGEEPGCYLFSLLPERHPRRFGVMPLHSPLLRQSWLLSFPPLSDMLKFGG